MGVKAKWQAEGEKSTQYFCNLEKKHQLYQNLSWKINRRSLIQNKSEINRRSLIQNKSEINRRSLIQNKSEMNRRSLIQNKSEMNKNIFIMNCILVKNPV